MSWVAIAAIAAATLVLLLVAVVALILTRRARASSHQHPYPPYRPGPAGRREHDRRTHPTDPETIELPPWREL